MVAYASRRGDSSTITDLGYKPLEPLDRFLDQGWKVLLDDVAQTPAKEQGKLIDFVFQLHQVGNVTGMDGKPLSYHWQGVWGDMAILASKIRGECGCHRFCMLGFRVSRLRCWLNRYDYIQSSATSIQAQKTAGNRTTWPAFLRSSPRGLLTRVLIYLTSGCMRYGT